MSPLLHTGAPTERTLSRAFKREDSCGCAHLRVVMVHLTRKAAVFVDEKAEAPFLFKQGFFATICNKFLDFILARSNGFYILGK